MLKHGPLCQQRLAAPWDQRLSQPLAPSEVGKIHGNRMVLLYGLRIIIVFWMGKCGKLREYYIDDMVLCGLIISIMFGEIKRGENHWEIYGKTMI